MRLLLDSPFTPFRDGTTGSSSVHASLRLVMSFPLLEINFFFECVSSVHVLPIAMFILFVYNWHPEKEKREMLGL
jgi:hypothetical protein